MYEIMILNKIQLSFMSSTKVEAFTCLLLIQECPHFKVALSFSIY